MKHVFTPTTLLKHARCGALLLALGAAGPAARAQTFGPPTDYAVSVQPYGVALGDLNGDRRPDLVVSNSNIQQTRVGVGSVSVLLALPGGGLGPPSIYEAGPTP